MILLFVFFLTNDLMDEAVGKLLSVDLYGFFVVSVKLSDPIPNN